MSKNDGGPAFPLSQEFWEKDRKIAIEQHSGMSLRDWFAGQALAGMIAGRFSPTFDAEVKVQDAIAMAAYFYADAMLKAREQS